MIRLTFVLTITILTSSVLGLFYIKHKVQNFNKDLAELNKQYTQEQESIRVLKAEWAYLNQPERLKKLAKKYLNLDNIKLAQIRKFNENAPLYFAENKQSKPVKNPNNYAGHENNIVKIVKHKKSSANQKEKITSLRY